MFSQTTMMMDITREKKRFKGSFRFDDDDNDRFKWINKRLIPSNASFCSSFIEHFHNFFFFFFRYYYSFYFKIGFNALTFELYVRSDFAHFPRRATSTHATEPNQMCIYKYIKKKGNFYFFLFASVRYFFHLRSLNDASIFILQRLLFPSRNKYVQFSLRKVFVKTTNRNEKQHFIQTRQAK